MSSSPMLAEPKPEIPATTTPSAGVLTTERLQSFQADFGAKPAYKLAQQAGVNPNTLSRLINGIEPLKADDERIIAVGQIIGVSVEDCFHEEEQTANE